MNYPNKHSLDVKSEQDDVAVFNDIVAAFLTHFTGFFGADLAVTANIIVKGDDFSADKAAFKIGMDYGGGLWGFHARRDRPGPGFSWARG